GGFFRRSFRLKTPLPQLWRKRPRFGFAMRMKATLLAVLLGIMLVPLITWAQTASAPAAAPATMAAAATEAAATTSAPALPGWLSGGLTEPDPTGGNYGVWATPGLDGKGDDRSKMTTSDLYDRITHNLFSINMVWTLIEGFLVMFMQLGFAM